MAENILTSKYLMTYKFLHNKNKKILYDKKEVFLTFLELPVPSPLKIGFEKQIWGPFVFQGQVQSSRAYSVMELCLFHILVENYFF